MSASRISSAGRPVRQYGAIPYRMAGDGLRVLLVTSRETRRWIIPRGNPMRGRKPHKAAAIEAFEEAGVVGRIRSKALGSFVYDKVRTNGSHACSVKVFPLRVREVRDKWPEAHERERRWFSPEDAADLVQEPGLAELLRSFHPKKAAKAR
jgi:8-oxo-dGTP pyrophosphatase MutT (NUDIX family)